MTVIPHTPEIKPRRLGVLGKLGLFSDAVSPKGRKRRGGGGKG